MPDKTIKLFVDAHAFDSEYQGTQTFIHGLYEQLLANHPHLDIYWGAENINNLLTIFPSIKAENVLIYKKRKPSVLRLLLDIPPYLKKHQIDFAHFQYLSPLPVKGCQYIVTTHDVLYKAHPNYFSAIYRWSRAWLFGWSIKNAAIKTTVSNYSKQEIAAHYNIAPAELKVIPNGVKRNTRSKALAQAIIKKKFNVENFILYVSRVEPRKNHDMLLKTYLKLELYKLGISLVFIGCQSIPNPQLNELVAGLTGQQQSMFKWIKQVDEYHLQNFYSASKVFVYPSRAEGFGIPPLEAAVSNIPVICSSATAMADFDFFKPYLFNPDDDFAFEQQLKKVIQSPPPVEVLNHIAECVHIKYQWHLSAQIFSELLILNTQHAATNTLQPRLSYLNLTPQAIYK